MQEHYRRGLCYAVGLVLALAGESSAGLITVTLGSAQSDLVGYGSAADVGILFPLTAPLAEPDFGSVDTTIVLNESAEQAQFAFGSEQEFPGIEPGVNFGVVGSYAIVVFQVNEAATYSFSGTASISGGLENTTVSLVGGLLDATDGIYLFDDFQFTGPAGSPLTLGNGTPYFSSSSGHDLTGSLIAGHVYRVDFYVQTVSYDDVDSHAFGDMNFIVRAADVSAVPEPTSMALLGTGVLGLCGYGARRRRMNHSHVA